MKVAVLYLVATLVFATAVLVQHFDSEGLRVAARIFATGKCMFYPLDSTVK